jgi:hypothetical protein
MLASGETQISLTDPDARAMTSQSHSAYTVGYNVQGAVDTEHHLIVAHEVTKVGARSATRCDDRAPFNRRASLRHHQGLDGATHFKMRTLRNAATEMALRVLAYNLKRVIAILGVPALLEAIRAFLSLLATLVRLTGASSALAMPASAKVSD